MKAPLTPTPDYFILNELVFRSPVSHYNQKVSSQFIKNKLTDKFFVEAIYLASPVLYHQSIKLLNGKIETQKQEDKILASLTRYYIRMSTRATPFGLFAGCGLAKWDQQTVSQKQKICTRHTRMDMYFLCKLATCLLSIKDIRNAVQFFPNNTGYTVGTEWRYIEYVYAEDTRRYQLSSIIMDETIQTIFSNTAKGKSLDKLALLFKNSGIPPSEINQYLDELVNNQVLVSELEPQITGNGYLEQMIEVLVKYQTNNIPEINKTLSVLNKLKNKLALLDKKTINDIEAYADIITLLNSFSISLQESKLFQVDTFFKEDKAETVSLHVKQQIQESIGILAALSEYRPNKNLQHFIEQYKNRYEEKQMPLVQVLDQEYGIGYNKVLEIDEAALINNLDLHSSKEEALNVQLTSFQLKLLQKVIAAADNKNAVIDLKENDFPKQTKSINNWPTSINITFSILDDKETIKVDGFGAGSAKNLIARFAYGNKSVSKIATAIANAEHRLHPDCILAEVVHLPEDRTGNILQHQPFHRYEIPYLAKSAMQTKYQIDINDITIRIQNNRIILWSVKLDKQILPKLSNAHNYKIKTLPVYNFLCDLQTQEYNGWYGLNIDFMLDITAFIPTIKCKNILLYPATWKIHKHEIKDLINNYSTQTWKQFIKQKKLPAQFVLAESDNELLIDTKNEWLIKVFLSAVKGKQSFLLKDVYLNNRDTSCIQNEYMAFGINQQPVSVSAIQPVKHKQLNVQRTFLPGTKWLYIKIYCGFKIADGVLNEQITFILTKLYDVNAIKKWFFVRYKDPDNHIRIRILLADMALTQEALRLINKAFAGLVKNGTVTKIKTDTYIRELERYGHNFIEITESVFYAQSKMFLTCLNTGLLNAETRWLIALYLCYIHLNAFELSEQQKVELIEQISKGFFKEFEVDKLKEQSLNKRYNDKRKIIFDALQNNHLPGIDPVVSDKLFGSFHKELSKQHKKIVNRCNNSDEVTSAIKNLLPSYLHMLINKIISSQQRANELVLYHFLHRFYQAKQFLDEPNKAKS